MIPGFGIIKKLPARKQQICHSSFGISGFSFLFRVFIQRLSRLFSTEPRQYSRDGCFTLTLDPPPLLSRFMMIVSAEQPYPEFFTSSGRLVYVGTTYMR